MQPLKLKPFKFSSTLKQLMGDNTDYQTYVDAFNFVNTLYNTKTLSTWCCLSEAPFIIGI